MLLRQYTQKKLKSIPHAINPDAAKNIISTVNK